MTVALILLALILALMFPVSGEPAPYPGAGLGTPTLGWLRRPAA